MTLHLPEAQMQERRREQRRQAQARYRERHRQPPSTRPEPKSREHHLERMRIWRLANIYGITVERYDEMLAEQGGVCAICQRAPQPGRNLDVDHDHACCPGGGSRSGRKCGRCVRGLLCRSCNSALHMVERPEHMARALVYLGRTA